MSSQSPESSLGLAWRVLATLEGGTLALVAAALVGNAARGILTVKVAEPQKPPETVMISNRSSVGLDIKRRLQSHGCAVSIATSEETSDKHKSCDTQTGSKVDALIVIGAYSDSQGLNGISRLVTEDIHCNIESLHSLSGRVRAGGQLVWVSRTSRATSGAFSGAKDALDNVVKTQLELIAKTLKCKSIFVSPCTDEEELAERTVSALLPNVNAPLQYSRFSLRNALRKICEYFAGGLKNIAY